MKRLLTFVLSLSVASVFAADSDMSEVPSLLGASAVVTSGRSVDTAEVPVPQTCEDSSVAPAAFGGGAAGGAGSAAVDPTKPRYDTAPLIELLKSVSVPVEDFFERLAKYPSCSEADARNLTEHYITLYKSGEFNTAAEEESDFDRDIIRAFGQAARRALGALEIAQTLVFFPQSLREKALASLKEIGFKDVEDGIKKLIEMSNMHDARWIDAYKMTESFKEITGYDMTAGSVRVLIGGVNWPNDNVLEIWTELKPLLANLSSLSYGHHDVMLKIILNRAADPTMRANLIRFTAVLKEKGMSATGYGLQTDIKAVQNLMIPLMFSELLADKQVDVISRVSGFSKTQMDKLVDDLLAIYSLAAAIERIDAVPTKTDRDTVMVLYADEFKRFSELCDKANPQYPPALTDTLRTTQASMVDFYENMNTVYSREFSGSEYNPRMQTFMRLEELKMMRSLHELTGSGAGACTIV